MWTGYKGRSPRPDAESRTPKARRLLENEVIPVHSLVTRSRQKLPDLRRLHPDDPPQLDRRVVHDPLSDRPARSADGDVRRDLDRIARLEVALDLGDSDGQQRRAALAQRRRGTLVDHEAAVRRLGVLEPQLEAGHASLLRQEAGPGVLPRERRPDDLRLRPVRDA